MYQPGGPHTYKPEARLAPGWLEIMQGAQRAAAAGSGSAQPFPVRSAFNPIPPAAATPPLPDLAQLSHGQLHFLSQLGGHLGGLSPGLTDPTQQLSASDAQPAASGSKGKGKASSSADKASSACE